MHLLAGIEQHVSSTMDDMGRERTSVTYLHRIVFVGIVNDLAVNDMLHRRDEGNLQDAAVIRDQAGRVRPGYVWSLRRSKFRKYLASRQEDPKGSWDREALQFPKVPSESGHSVIPATTFFKLSVPFNSRLLHTLWATF